MISELIFYIWYCLGVNGNVRGLLFFVEDMLNIFFIFIDGIMLEND